MADPLELLNAWQRAVVASLGSTPVAAASFRCDPAAPSRTAPAGAARQLEFERELLGRAVAPLRGARELVDQATGTWRAQATSFRASVEDLFGQLAGLMDQQADPSWNVAPGCATRSRYSDPPVTMYSPTTKRQLGSRPRLQIESNRDVTQSPDFAGPTHIIEIIERRLWKPCLASLARLRRLGVSG